MKVQFKNSARGVATMPVIELVGVEEDIIKAHLHIKQLVKIKDSIFGILNISRR